MKTLTNNDFFLNTPSSLYKAIQLYIILSTAPYDYAFVYTFDSITIQN